MAIVTQAQTIYPHGWAVAASSADVSGNETLQAAPGAGKYLVVERVVFNSVADIALTLKADTATIIGPLSFGAQGVFEWTPKRPVILPVNKALKIDASGAGAVAMYAEGYIK